MKRFFTLMFTLLLVSLVSLALGQEKVFKSTEVGKAGGTFRITTNLDPTTFNPFVGRTDASGNIFGWLYPPLTATSPYTFAPEGYLASSWQIENGGRAIVFKLRSGAKWSDGQALDADDVVFSAMVYSDLKVNSPRRFNFLVDGELIKWTKIDATTVRAELPKPYAPALLQNWPIAPEHIFAEAYKAGKLAEVYGLDTPPASIVAGGPWVLESYTKGEQIVYKRNPLYWGTDERGNKVPYLERCVVSIVPSPEARLAKFLAGETDYFDAPNADVVAAVSEAIKSGKLKGQVFPNATSSTFTNILIFNWNNKDSFKAQLFRQLTFRKAMTHLINKQAMIETALGGLGRAQWSPFSPANPTFFNEDVVKYPYDPAKATALLAELGFRTKNPEGFLINSEGKVLEFNFATIKGDIPYEKMAQIWTEDARKIGVKVNYQPVEVGELIRALSNPNPDGTRDFDAISIGLGYGPDPAYYSGAYRIGSPQHSWNMGPGASYQPFETLMDKLMVQGASTFDLAERKKIYTEFQQVAAENLPFIYVVTPASNPAWNTRMGGIFTTLALPYIETLFVKE